MAGYTNLNKYVEEKYLSKFTQLKSDSELTQEALAFLVMFLQ